MSWREKQGGEETLSNFSKLPVLGFNKQNPVNSRAQLACTITLTRNPSVFILLLYFSYLCPSLFFLLLSHAFLFFSFEALSPPPSHLSSCFPFHSFSLSPTLPCEDPQRKLCPRGKGLLPPRSWPSLGDTSLCLLQFDFAYSANLHLAPTGWPDTDGIKCRQAESCAVKWGG